MADVVDAKERSPCFFVLRNWQIVANIRCGGGGMGLDIWSWLCLLYNMNKNTTPRQIIDDGKKGHDDTERDTIFNNTLMDRLLVVHRGQRVAMDQTIFNHHLGLWGELVGRGNDISLVRLCAIDWLAF